MRVERWEGHAECRLCPLGSHSSRVPGAVRGRRGGDPGKGAMSTASIASQDMRIPLEGAFLPHRQGLEGLPSCWNSHSDRRLEKTFFEVDPVTVAYGLNASAEQPSGPTAHVLCPGSEKGPGRPEHSQPVLPLKPGGPRKEPGSDPEEGALLPGFGRLSLGLSGVSDRTPPHTPVKKGGPAGFLFPPGPSGDRSVRPLPPLPVAPKDFLRDEMDREVEFLTSSDTDPLLANSSLAFQPSAQGRRSFRGCGQINYAYADTPGAPTLEEPPSGCPQPSSCPPPPPPPPPPQLHRRLRRSHSGPAGSFHKPVVRVSSHLRQASPCSDDDKPEVPPRVPIPPRALKPDYRRWSAEVASSAYSDEDKPPKVPPREPLSRNSSRTPSPKSLPSYLKGIMPPTQSFAPDPKYVSNKALQRQHSEGSAHRIPCILPIIENGRKVSSTHYYLLPERPPYLDRYEKFFQEAEEAAAVPEGPLLWDERDDNMEEVVAAAAAVTDALAAPVKRKHFSCVVSP
uniref:ERBB receptor feedback inhibitor 1 isoform X1 n=2 Tax=Pogona vitticeps TaxID=103695 RepID=A0A6J0U918_9SAUR